MGTLDVWVQVPYLDGSVCQQKEITIICYSFINFTPYNVQKRIGNYLLYVHATVCDALYLTKQHNSYSFS